MILGVQDSVPNRWMELAEIAVPCAMQTSSTTESLVLRQRGLVGGALGSGPPEKVLGPGLHSTSQVVSYLPSGPPWRGLFDNN